MLARFDFMASHIWESNYSSYWILEWTEFTEIGEIRYNFSGAHKSVVSSVLREYSFKLLFGNCGKDRNQIPRFENYCAPQYNGTVSNCCHSTNVHTLLEWWVWSELDQLADESQWFSRWHSHTLHVNSTRFLIHSPFESYS